VSLRDYLSAVVLMLASAPASAFDLYDATAFLDKPDLSSYGIQPLAIVGSGLLGKRRDQDIRAAAQPYAKATGYVLLDIEDLCVDERGCPTAQVRKNIDKLVHYLAVFRTVANRAKLGYYSVIPIRDYWSPVSGEPDRIAAWQHANDQLGNLASAVDAIFPSIYTFYPDRAGWEVYANANIDEAQAYGKAVYPFLWMDYHAEPPDQPLEADYWTLELQTCEGAADGAVIWGGWHFGDPYGREEWDAKAPWWLATLDFIAP